MTKFLLATCILVAALCQPIVSAEELTLGSKAPKLEVQKFIKGEPVKGFLKGKIYVVELWATWCGPCKATIPHLTALQKKHEDVIFIGVAVLEDDVDAVSTFVDEMGKKMDYRVALDLVPEGGDPREGKLVKNWMEPAEQEGIPTAFIVNGDSKIAWIGHPGQMEEPLAQIVEGKWDLVAEAKKYDEAKELQKKANEANEKYNAMVGQLQKLYAKFGDDGNPDDVLIALDSAVKDYPEKAPGFELMRFSVLSLTKDRIDDAIAIANTLIESENGENLDLLNNLAWIVVNPERETKADSKLLKLALKVAIKADNLAKQENPLVADTLAKAYFDNSDLPNAVKAQTRVVELAEGTPMAADPGLKKRLSQYQKALKNASAKSKEPSDTAKPIKK